MTFETAVERFDELNAAERIPRLSDGSLGSISKARRNVVVSHVRSALIAASGGSPVHDVELGPYLEMLPEAARADAERHGRSQPRVEASNVRLFLLAVEGHRSDLSRRRPVCRESFLPTWRPLFDALEGSSGLAGYARDLAFFQEFVMGAFGPVSPHDIPDRLELEARTTSENRSEVRRGISSFRKARELLGDDRIPVLVNLDLCRGRGLLSVPAVREELRTGNLDVDALDDLTVVDRMRIIAPRIADAVDAYLDWARSSKSRSWLEQSVPYAFSHLVAELVRMDVELNMEELDLIDLYTETVTVETTARAGGLVARHVSGPTNVIERSLLAHALERGARRVVATSPLELADEGSIRAGDLPFYPPSTKKELTAIWAVTREVYGNNLGEGIGMIEAARDTWLEVEREAQRIRSTIAELNAHRRVRGQIDKSLLCLTWAEAVCVGVPWSRSRTLEARDRYYLAVNRAEEGQGSERTLRDARNEYEKVLKRHLGYSLLLDDGLRAKNYSEGRMNQHFLPTFRESGGRIVGIEQLRTRWRGHDPIASLKMSEDVRGRERSRTKLVSPGIVDMELLSDYVLHLRPLRLVDLGLLPDIESYDPRTDEFALFVSPRSTKPCGGYSSSRQLSEWFGDMLLDVMRLAGYPHVPTREELASDAEISKKWRGVLGAHAVRTLIAVWFGLILEDWSQASWLTDDDEQTLRKHYVALSDDLRARVQSSGVDSVQRFRGVAQALRDGAVVDWGSFDPEHPEQFSTRD